MTEPVLPTLAGFKVWLFGLPIFVAIIAFWLGILAVPLSKGREVRDLVYRVMSCVVSSFLVGIPALISLKKFMPEVFTLMDELSVHAQIDPFAGFLVLAACVMLLSSLPGPWIVGSVFMFLEKQKDKPIDEVISSFRKGD